MHCCSVLLCVFVESDVSGAALQELVRLLKRVVIQPPVEVRSYNSSHHFSAAPYRCLADITLQTCREFGIPAAQLTDQARFYWLPEMPGAALNDRLQQRKTLRTERDWEQFLDAWNEQHNARLIVLYFVSGELSPSLVECPPPPSPPRLHRFDDEEKSEPQSDHGLSERDHGRCIVCGHEAHVEAAHVVDKHRAELLDGAPDAPQINDLRNLWQLCPNHHASFDDYEWTLVEEERTLADGVTATGFWVRPTPIKPKPSPDISLHMQKFIRFPQPDRSPPGYLFLLKQLGRFPVPCRVCDTLFDPKSLPGHYGGTHRTDEEEKAKWKGKSHLLPRPCACPVEMRGQTPWALYCHIVAKHRELLYE